MMQPRGSRWRRSDDNDVQRRLKNKGRCDQHRHEGSEGEVLMRASSTLLLPTIEDGLTSRYVFDRALETKRVLKGVDTNKQLTLRLDNERADGGQ